MITLYLVFMMMLLSALSLLAIPLLANRHHKKLIFSRGFLIISMTMIFFSFVLYQFSGDKTALAEWLNHGQQRYQLMVQINELGGIDGMIARVKRRLQENPGDEQGKLILKKLYKIKNASQ